MYIYLLSQFSYYACRQQQLQRVDDVSIDCISYGNQSLETMGFAL